MSTKRFSIFPIHYPNIWKFHKTQLSNFWVAEELDLQADVEHWAKMDPNLRLLLSRVLAIFNFSDIVVCDNLKEITNLIEPYNITEAEFFYHSQSLIECIHSETYAIFIETLIKSEDERNKLLHAVENFEFAKKKAAIMSKYQGENSSLSEKIINNACGEQIGFSSLFAVIFWLRKMNIMNGLRHGNSLISQDENLHASCAIEIYKTLCRIDSKHQLSSERIQDIVKDFVNVELQVLEDIFEGIPSAQFDELTKESLSQYIKYMADIILTSLGHQKLYKVANPFEFMTLINLREQHAMFETKACEYKLFNVNHKEQPQEKEKAYDNCMSIDF